MGRMFGEGQRQFRRRNAATIVNDADEFSPAILYLHDDLRGPGINGVFDKFLDDGGGALDDFTGGDAVYEGGGELLNRASGHSSEV